jgi:ABC-type hemin transport system substrate-binding protein
VWYVIKVLLVRCGLYRLNFKAKQKQGERIMETVIVTRHAALVEYLLAEGIVPNNTPVLSHASPEAITGKHVIGILPLSLAALAAKVTVVPLSLPPELRGVELTIEQVRQYAGSPETYRVLSEESVQDINSSVAYTAGWAPFED